MIDPKLLRENPRAVKDGAAYKNVDIDIDAITALDEKRRTLIAESQAVKAEQNQRSKGIAEEKDEAKRSLLIAEVSELKTKFKDMEEELDVVEKDYQAFLKMIPNLPKPDVKIGKDDSQNYTIREVGEKPVFDFEPKDYMTIGEDLDIIDTERGVKLSGTRFAILKGDAALLEFALINYAMTMLTAEGFIPLITPELITEDSMASMGYLDRSEEEVYKTVRDGYRLVGTSEQAVGPMHANETFNESELPKRYIAFSSCFRREAGSYGKDTRGIMRLHQFDKCEMFSFTTPEASDGEHDYLLSLEEKLMTALGLHYRVVGIVSGDLGDPAARKYDIETWVPSQETFRETHSTSTCTDWQSRRLGIRLKRNNGDMQFAHTLNGTAFAIQRTLLVIMENYQQADGSIEVPAVLVPYMGGKTVIGKK